PDRPDHRWPPRSGHRGRRRWAPMDADGWAPIKVSAMPFFGSVPVVRWHRGHLTEAANRVWYGSRPDWRARRTPCAEDQRRTLQRAPPAVPPADGTTDPGSRRP